MNEPCDKIEEALQNLYQAMHALQEREQMVINVPARTYDIFIDHMNRKCKFSIDNELIPQYPLQLLTYCGIKLLRQQERQSL